LDTLITHRSDIHHDSNVYPGFLHHASLHHAFILNSQFINPALGGQ
jgi:hypothetical protein